MKKSAVVKGIREGRFLIEYDYKGGESLELLNSILKEAFPKDKSPVRGWVTFYGKDKTNAGKWVCNNFKEYMKFTTNNIVLISSIKQDEQKIKDRQYYIDEFKKGSIAIENNMKGNYVINEFLKDCGFTDFQLSKTVFKYYYKESPYDLVSTLNKPEFNTVQLCQIPSKEERKNIPPVEIALNTISFLLDAMQRAQELKEKFETLELKRKKEALKPINRDFEGYPEDYFKINKKKSYDIKIKDDSHFSDSLRYAIYNSFLSKSEPEFLEFTGNDVEYFNPDKNRWEKSNFLSPVTKYRIKKQKPCT